MFEDYEELFDSVEGANAIIAQAKADLVDLLTDEVKEIIYEAANKKDELDNLNRELRTVEWQIGAKKSELADVQKRCEQAEMRDIPRKYIDKFVRNATGHFAPGDTVWYLASKVKRIPCYMCNGKEDVLANIGTDLVKIRCPACSGYGEKSITEKVVEQRKVASVHLELCFSPDRVNYWNTKCVYLDRDEYSSDVKNIFRTEEEALAALKERAKDGK